MSFYPIKVSDQEDSRKNYDYILEGIHSAEEFEYPSKMTSPHSKAKYFKKNNPDYHKIPNSLLKGYFRFGKPKTDGMKGFRLHRPLTLHIWGLGYIYFDKGIPPLIRNIKQLTFRDNYEIVFHSTGKIGSNKKIVLRDYKTSDLNILMKEDPIFRYLKVNDVFKEFGHKKTCAIRDVIDYLDNNPSLTRLQLEELGIRGDRLWDLVVNYQPSLDVILRAGSKPEMKYKFLSKGQYKNKLKKEWSLSEHLSPSDVDAGRLKNQSFDSQTYEAIRSDKESFFS